MQDDVPASPLFFPASPASASPTRMTPFDVVFSSSPASSSPPTRVTPFDLAPMEPMAVVPFIPTQKKKVWSKPSERTEAEHIGLTAIMRAAKAKKRKRITKERDRADRIELQREINKHVIRGHEIKLKRRKGCKGMGLFACSNRLMRRGRWVRPAAMVEMSFSNVGAAGSVAAINSCSVRAVKRGRQITAFTAMQIQDQRMQAASEPEIDFFVSSIAFDETDQKLALDAANVGKPVRSAWKCMASGLSLSFGAVKAKDVGEGCETNIMKITRPPVPLIAGAADVVYKSVWGMGFFKTTVEVEAKCAAKAKLMSPTRNNAENRTCALS